MNVMAFIIPAYFLFLGIEYLVARQQGKSQLFQYESSVSNISVGLAERMLNLFITFSFYHLYVWLYQHFALLHIPNHWLVWIALLLVTDFVWYWYHRLGHEINLFWAAHVVHHQSEEFNYTVSARITTIQALVRNSFWCVLPVIGFHPAMVTAILVVHGAYSFFTHTQLAGRFGWLEKVFITPTHHGVHHASNDQYLNKNYGDIFVWWDKLFGTFAEQTEKPVYGITQPVKSYSFLWQHFHYFAELAEACRRTGSWRASLLIIFGRPESIDKHIREDIERRILSKHRKINRQNTRLRTYINLQLFLTTAGLFFFTAYFEHLSGYQTACATGIILLSLINCGALLEQQRWIYFLELTRLYLIISFAGSYLGHGALQLTALMVLILLGSAKICRKLYFASIYGYSWNRLQ